MSNGKGPAMPSNNGHGIMSSWTGPATAMVFLTMLGGGAAIFQTQFTNLEKQLVTAHETLDKQTTLLREDTVQRFAAVSSALDKINGTLRADIETTLVSRREFDQFTARYLSLEATVARANARLTDVMGRQAHAPVEDATVNAINTAVDKRIDLIQAQIGDINRQIAAALIIIDSNNAPTAVGKRVPQQPPP